MTVDTWLESLKSVKLVNLSILSAPPSRPFSGNMTFNEHMEDLLSKFLHSMEEHSECGSNDDEPIQYGPLTLTVARKVSNTI